ncbi:MAG TPA: hypothetical protein VN455_03865 [Methanotrichaceae archaeon]|nr:hypothetical protein [Methanotrichaceae archaeon]
MCIFFLIASSYAVEIQSTGTNTATSGSTAEGDSFVIATPGTNVYSLTMGAWAHALCPTGIAGSATSERSVTLKSESRPQTGFGATPRDYDLTLNYDSISVKAAVTKTSTLGQADAYAEVSSRAQIDASTANVFKVSGDALIASSLAHSGSGTGEATATGYSDYLVGLKKASGQGYDALASGHASGTSTLEATNSYGGSVSGLAHGGSASKADLGGSNEASAESIEQLFLDSSRTASDGSSILTGSIQGTGSSLHDISLEGVYPTDFVGGSLVSTSQADTAVGGSLTGTARAYKVGDHAYPASGTMQPGLTSGITGMNDVQWNQKSASAMIISSAYASPFKGSAKGEAVTTANVSRVTSDLTNEAYCASYIDDGKFSAVAKNNTFKVSASVWSESNFLGSGAHMFGRLTGAGLNSRADEYLASAYAGDSTLLRGVYPTDFVGGSYGTPSEISWDFGDGTVNTTTATPTHNYAIGSKQDSKNVSVSVVYSDHPERSISVTTSTLNAISWKSAENNAIVWRALPGINSPQGILTQHGPFFSGNDNHLRFSLGFSLDQRSS